MFFNKKKPIESTTLDIVQMNKIIKLLNELEYSGCQYNFLMIDKKDIVTNLTYVNKDDNIDPFTRSDIVKNIIIEINSIDINLINTIIFQTPHLNINKMIISKKLEKPILNQNEDVPQSTLYQKDDNTDNDEFEDGFELYTEEFDLNINPEQISIMDEFAEKFLETRKHIKNDPQRDAEVALLNRLLIAYEKMFSDFNITTDILIDYLPKKHGIIIYRR